MAGRAELDRGRGLRAKCKSLSKTTWNYHERRQNNSVENVFQRFALSFVSFLRRKHDFRRRISTFVWRILFEEPRIWTSGFNLRTRALKSVTAAQKRLGMRSGCQAAKILPVGVRGTKNVWCLTSLMCSFLAQWRIQDGGCLQFFSFLFLYFKLISHYYFNGFCFHILLTFTFFLISIFTCYYSIILHAILYSNCNVFA